MVAGKVSVVKMGCFIVFLLIHVFFVLRCRRGSADTATQPFIILQSKERRYSCILSASGYRPIWDTILVTLLVWLQSIKTNMIALRYTLSNLSMLSW